MLYYIKIIIKITNTKYRTSYRTPLLQLLSRPCSSTPWPRPCTAPLVCRCMLSAPACHRGAGWTSSRMVADFPGLLLAVLGVAVLLGLLWTSLHLQLANLLGLEVAVLLLDWE